MSRGIFTPIETVHTVKPCFFCGNHEIDLYRAGAFYFMHCGCGAKQNVTLCPSKLRAVELWDGKIKEVLVHE